MLGLLLLFPILSGCKSKRASKRKKRSFNWRSRKKKAKPVHVTVIKTGDIESRLTATTTLTAESNVSIVAQVSGLVTRVYGRKGRRFARGAILARLSNRYLQIAFEKATLQVKKLQRDLARNKRLLHKGYVSKQTSEELLFQLAQAKNARKRAAEDLKNLTIRATISGIVTNDLLKRGAWAVPQTTAFVMESPRSLVAVIAVPEKNIPKLKTGLKAIIRAEALDSNTPVQGKVIRIDPTIDPKTGTIGVTIGKLTPLKKLKSGMFLTVNLILEQKKQVVLVPKQAVQYSKNQPYVYIAKGNCSPAKKSKKKCKASKRHFVKGLENATHIESKSGIRSNDKVITLGQQSLQSDSPIRIIKSE